MNFVPPIPQFTQQTYGMNYGDWHQYAGFGKNKPYGGSAMPMDRSGRVSPQPVPAPVDDTNPTAPVVPIVAQPVPAPGQYGVNPNGAYGANPNGIFGAPANTEKSPADLINEHYD